MDIYLGDDCHWHVLKLSDREVANESFHTLRDAVQGYDAGCLTFGESLTIHSRRAECVKALRAVK